MIKVTDRWSVYRDKYQWVLVDTYAGKDKDGNAKDHTRETYHPWLDYAMRSAADRDCEGAGVFSDIEKAYKNIQDSLASRSREVEGD